MPQLQLLLLFTVLLSYSEKTNKNTPTPKLGLTLRIYFKKYTVRKDCKALFFLVTSNIILSYILPKYFIETYQVSGEMNFYFSDFDYFLSMFWIFLPLLATKKLMASASIR